MKKVYNKNVIFHSIMSLEYILTTNFVEVTVLPIYIEEQSIPHENCYVWMYNVKIKNKSSATIQLLNRYWQIIDHEGKVNEITGIGVIGEQPIIRSGEVFKYTSGTYLSVPSGVMQGKYEFLNEESTKIFEVAIPAFSLDSPYTDIKLH